MEAFLSSHCLLDLDQTAAIVKRVGGSSLSHRAFTSFIPFLLSVFDPSILLQEG